MAGRPVAEEIAVCGVDVRLVDGDPVADQIAEAVGADVVQVIGSKFVLFLKKDKDSKFDELPR